MLEEIVLAYTGMHQAVYAINIGELRVRADGWITGPRSFLARRRYPPDCELGS